MAGTTLVMPRPDRFTPAGVPVHVTQRGNFRGRVFTEDSDYSFFLDMLGRYAGESGNRVIGYCLLSNHYHLVLIPERDRGVSDMMHSLNSKFARTINERYERTGHVLQGRFGSASMSDKHYRTALAYVDLNPVRAGLVTAAADYEWDRDGRDGVSVVECGGARWGGRVSAIPGGGGVFADVHAG